jgi:hypothetical protein
VELLQTEELKRKNKASENQLQKEEDGKEVEKRNTASENHEGEKCLVLGDSMLEENKNLTIECFPGIRAGQLHKVIENRDLGCPDTVIIHVGTNDLNRKRNFDYVMGEMYDIVAMAKNEFPRSRLVLSDVLRRRDMTWRRI